ncbi:MAG: cupin domain-containing protein [Solirubrobacterales bacterium]|nr:cupin domain-containing protein [Solirubrobacterales bacterium]MCB0860273.1 cupin domain-containing protein [Solirubrobacterales bacterium]HRV60392.1 cupin domain-containing protein [Solirubrobacterales bacterium]
MSNPFSSSQTLDVRYRSADQIRSGGALANLGNGPVIDSHGTPARLIAWPGTGFQTEAVHVLTLEPGHEGERYRYDMAEEAFLCHSGTAEVWLRGQWVSLEPGDIAYVPEGAERAIRNTGKREAILVVQITPPQIDLYVDHGFYNEEWAVINHDASDKARATAATVEMPEAEFEFRETHPEMRAWNLEWEEVRRSGALFNVLMGTAFSGIGLPMRLILWPGAGSRSVGFNYAYDPNGVTDELHTHPVSDECLIMWRGSGKFFIGGSWIDAKAGDVALAPCGVAHGHTSVGDETWLGGFASPPQLDLLMPTDYYDKGSFTAPTPTRLEVDTD